MERIHQMHVVPDLLPDLRPTIDLRLNFPEPPPKDVYRRSRVKRRYQKVDPGMYLLPEQVWSSCLESLAPLTHVTCTIDVEVPCSVYDSMAHRHTALYPVDGGPGYVLSLSLGHCPHILPDVPDEANQTFQSYLHWMQ